MLLYNYLVLKGYLVKKIFYVITLFSIGLNLYLLESEYISYDDFDGVTPVENSIKVEDKVKIAQSSLVKENKSLCICRDDSDDWESHDSSDFD